MEEIDKQRLATAAAIVRRFHLRKFRGELQQIPERDYSVILPVFVN